MKAQQKYLIVAILIPIIMILIVATSLLFPVKKLSPAYNFLFAIGDRSESYTCLQNIMAKFYPKKLNADFYKVMPGSCTKVKLFVYDFKTESARPITFADAKKLHLKQSLSSDENNFYISRDCYIGPDIGLWSMRESYNDVCLIKDDYKRLLNIKPEHPKQFSYFMSIGWIVPDATTNQEKKP